MKVKVIGASGRMGQIHCQTYRELGLEIVETGEDIVSIASPDQTHGEYVIEALQKGKHVFCEKPLCTSSLDLLSIEHIAQICPELHIGQNFPLRYSMAEILKSNILGLGTIYRAEGVYRWGRTYKLGKGWRTKGYSLVMGGLIHTVDMLIYLLGDLNFVTASGVNWCAPDFDGPDTVMAYCTSKTALVHLVLDGGTAWRDHAHEILLCGNRNNWMAIRTKPTDKTQSIKDFVKNLDKPPKNDFRATRLCLEIDECIASTSPAR